MTTPTPTREVLQQARDKHAEVVWSGDGTVTPWACVAPTIDGSCSTWCETKEEAEELAEFWNRGKRYLLARLDAHLSEPDALQATAQEATIDNIPRTPEAKRVWREGAVRDLTRGPHRQAAAQSVAEHFDELKATLEGAHSVMEAVSGLERRVGPVGSHARGYTHKITKALRHLEALRNAFAATPPAGERSPEVQPAGDEHPVIAAAGQWWCEREVNDWDEADLARAVIRHGGDWEGCPGCDHKCDEPCMPATVAEQLAGIDRRIAQLVHDGKLHAPDGYKPPDGWQPIRVHKRAGERSTPAEPPLEWSKAVQEAYGWLWHVNNEPMAPVPMWSPEKAAYEARKNLRELLTHAQRGEAINAVGALLANMAATPPSPQPKGAEQP